MVKSIQLRVDDDVHEKLKKIKGDDRTWEEFLVPEAGLQYAEVVEKAREWDEIEPHLPRLTAHLLIEYLKKAADHMLFKDEEAEKVE